MVFEPVTSDDLDPIRDLQPDDWSDIIPHMQYYIRADFCYPIKVILDNRIVGTGTMVDLQDTIWLAHIIIHNAYRSRGIGYQLVEELMRNTISNCETPVLLTATKLGEPLYAKHGFRAISDYVFMTRQKPWNSGHISLNIIPYDIRYRQAIYEMDRRVTGENRERILLSFLKSGHLFIRNNKVRGYYLPDLGEGLIIADDREAGLELMKMKYATVDKAVLPAENTAGIAFLKENGFMETSTGKRMMLGQDITWKPDNIYSRIGGNFG